MFPGSLKLTRLFSALYVTAIAFICVSIWLIYMNTSVGRRRPVTRENLTPPSVCTCKRSDETPHQARRTAVIYKLTEVPV